MDKDKSSLGGGFLPPSGRFSTFLPTGNPNFNLNPEPSSSSFLPLAPDGSSSDGPHFGHQSGSSHFSHDISRMPDNPPKKVGHRRYHSEILTLPDDISFDSDLGVVGVDEPSFSDEAGEDLFAMYLDMDKLNSSTATSSFQVGEPSAAAVQAPAAAGGGGSSAEIVGVGSSERPKIRHQHSQSMDGSTSPQTDMLIGGSEETPSSDIKKAMSAAKLAELALIDPKRAKRIWANRQSAARSKERKMRYIAELERKVQTLQTEATSLSAQLTLLQRDANGLAAENNELKLRLQTMEQQINLQDALNEALKEEIHHLKVMTGQAMLNGGPMMNFASFGGGQQFYPNNHAMHTLLTTQQFQQLQIQSQKQQHHQFQQHQQQHQLKQEQEQEQQQVADLQMRGSVSSQNQKDNASDRKPPATKD